MNILLFIWGIILLFSYLRHGTVPLWNLLLFALYIILLPAFLEEERLAKIEEEEFKLRRMISFLEKFRDRL